MIDPYLGIRHPDLDVTGNEESLFVNEESLFVNEESLFVNEESLFGTILL